MSLLFPDGWICQDVILSKTVNCSLPSSGQSYEVYCPNGPVEKVSFTETFSVPIEGGDYWTGDYNTAVAEMREFVSSLPEQSQYQHQGYEIQLGKRYTCGGLGTFLTRLFSTSIEMFRTKK